MSIRAGSQRHDRGGVSIPLKRVIKHEKWDESTIDYDYGLLELSAPLKFSDKIQKIELPNETEEVADDTVCFVSGILLYKPYNFFYRKCIVHGWKSLNRQDSF